MNEIIFLIIILLTILLTFCLYKLLDKRGFYFSLVILNICAFILTFKITTILKLNVNLGIVPYLGVLTIFYIFMIKYGYKENKDLIKISLCTNVITAILLVIMNYFVPAITETISINIEETFKYNYKILIAFPLIMLLSQYLVCKLFKYISGIQSTKWICILLTYIITGIFYTTIFYILSYIKVLNIKDSTFVGISSYIVGLVITIINILFVYLLTKSKKVIK